MKRRKVKTAQVEVEPANSPSSTVPVHHLNIDVSHWRIVASIEARELIKTGKLARALARFRDERCQYPDPIQEFFELLGHVTGNVVFEGTHHAYLIKFLGNSTKIMKISAWNGPN